MKPAAVGYRKAATLLQRAALHDKLDKDSEPLPATDAYTCKSVRIQFICVYIHTISMSAHRYVHVHVLIHSTSVRVCVCEEYTHQHKKHLLYMNMYIESSQGQDSYPATPLWAPTAGLSFSDSDPEKQRPTIGRQCDLR